MSIYLKNKETPSTLHASDSGSKEKNTYYLASNPQYYEPQRSNTFMFRVNFPKDYFIADPDLARLNSYASANADEVLRVSVNKAFIPHFKVDPIQLKRGNNTMKFAGTPTFDAGTIELDDFIGAGTKELLMAWQRKVYDVHTEKVGLASDYKLNATLVEYTPDWQPVRSWTLAGCWVSGLSEGEYSADNADKHTISATIEYDKAWIDADEL